MERPDHPVPGAEARLADLGLALPPVFAPPAGTSEAVRPVRVHVDRAVVSPVGADGTDVRLAVRDAALALLAVLRRELGSLDRITAWLSIEGRVLVAPDEGTPEGLLDPVSDLVAAVFGPEIGAHARSLIGVGSLPGGWTVALGAEVVVGPDEHGRTLVAVLAETIPLTPEEPIPG